MAVHSEHRHCFQGRKFSPAHHFISKCAGLAVAGTFLCQYGPRGYSRKVHCVGNGRVVAQHKLLWLGQSCGCGVAPRHDVHTFLSRSKFKCAAATCGLRCTSQAGARQLGLPPLALSTTNCNTIPSQGVGGAGTWLELHRSKWQEQLSSCNAVPIDGVS
jgi:hypothetical protein